MKDSEIIKYIYENNYKQGECWCEWDLLDWIDFDRVPIFLRDELVKVLVKSFEGYILSKYKFYHIRPEYSSMREIEKQRLSYMHPLNKFRQRYRYYKLLKLRCLNYE